MMSTESISEHLVQIWHVLQTSRVFHSFVVVFSVNAMKPFQLRRRRRYYIHRKRNDIQPLHNEFEAAAKEIQFRDEMQMRTVWIETRVETRERKVLFVVSCGIAYDNVIWIQNCIAPSFYDNFVRISARSHLNVIAVRNVITISGVNTLDKINKLQRPFCCSNSLKPYLAIVLVFSS